LLTGGRKSAKGIDRGAVQTFSLLLFDASACASGLTQDDKPPTSAARSSSPACIGGCVMSAALWFGQRGSR